MLADHVKRIIINTGNLISSKELKKKAIQTPTEEVFDSISTVFLSWLSRLQEEAVNDSTSVYCVSPHAIKANQSDRAELKISIKIFLGHYDCEDLKTSILEMMNSLDVNVVDSLILSLPLKSLEEKFDLEKMKPLWTILENFVHEGKLITIGVSDLDTPELAELYEWAEIKPSVNQVNIESCCVMPPELTAFAKEHDIQLLTHNDPKVLLPDKMLHNILESAVTTYENWKISWIVRYAVVIKCRGIIQNKGYLMCTEKNT
ncbi:glutamate--cysteine ligase regulatory subunit-like isoform X2 [Argiope bruennichi]|uniref:GCS light chain n=1 Tax=Argiope bruennichi TaxID=94029 RepID=A0A8T0G3U2_ARGBR|nr:glutamate--cysteine ligase regulatory subunit-like isoform X2 [Argiope bruennichi]KAF8797195.1 Glutamate--cysteine ligase regulatory subunit like protein [Argiope bruennichi]